MNENSVITKTRRRKLCMAASDPEKPLAVITHVAFGSGGVNVSGEPIVPTETQTALNSELARYEVESVTYPDETTARYTVTIPKDSLVGKEINEAALVEIWWLLKTCIQKRRTKVLVLPLNSMTSFNLKEI